MAMSSTYPTEVLFFSVMHHKYSREKKETYSSVRHTSEILWTNKMHTTT